MYKYYLSNEAENDLIRIYLYGVSQFGIEQADLYYNNFFEHFEIIAGNPYSFQAVDNIKKGYRRCVCNADSIYYRILDNSVEIISIIGRQDLNQAIK